MYDGVLNLGVFEITGVATGAICGQGRMREFRLLPSLA